MFLHLGHQGAFRQRLGKLGKYAFLAKQVAGRAALHQLIQQVLVDAHSWVSFQSSYHAKAKDSGQSQVNGVRHYLWRAVDHEGEVLESYVTKTRDKKAALKFLRKAMRKHGRPELIVTDRLRSFGAVMKEIGNAHKQQTGRWLNNRLKIRTCPFDEGNGRCCVSSACVVCRNPLPFAPQSTPFSILSAVSIPDQTSN